MKDYMGSKPKIYVLHSRRAAQENLTDSFTAVVGKVALAEAIIADSNLTLVAMLDIPEEKSK